ncbi:MAG: hypothetical protein Q3972_04680 [Corynebacterium sp.]|nr:hypothetical protein [Corynebacterium sp.]
MVINTAFTAGRNALKLGRSGFNYVQDRHLKKLAKGIEPGVNAVESNIAELTSRAMSKIDAATDTGEALVKKGTKKVKKVKKSKGGKKCCGCLGKVLGGVVVFGALAGVVYVISQKFFGKPSTFPEANENTVTGEDNPGGGNYVFNTSTQPE